MADKHYDLQEQLGFFTFLYYATASSFLISYYIDFPTMSFVWEEIFGKTLNLFSFLEITVKIYLSFLITITVLWYLRRFKIPLDEEWFSWSVVVSNIAWLFVPVFGILPVLLLNNPLTAPFIIYTLTVVGYLLTDIIAKKVLKKEDFSIWEYVKKLPVLPDSADIFAAILSAFVGILLKAIISVTI